MKVKWFLTIGLVFLCMGCSIFGKAPLGLSTYSADIANGAPSMKMKMKMKSIRTYEMITNWFEQFWSVDTSNWDYPRFLQSLFNDDTNYYHNTLNSIYRAMDEVDYWIKQVNFRIAIDNTPLGFMDSLKIQPVNKIIFPEFNNLMIENCYIVSNLDGYKHVVYKRSDNEEMVAIDWGSRISMGTRKIVDGKLEIEFRDCTHGSSISRLKLKVIGTNHFQIVYIGWGLKDDKWGINSYFGGGNKYDKFIIRTRSYSNTNATATPNDDFFFIIDSSLNWVAQDGLHNEGLVASGGRNLSSTNQLGDVVTVSAPYNTYSFDTYIASSNSIAPSKIPVTNFVKWIVQ